MGDFTLYSAEGRQVTVPDPPGGIADAAGNSDGLLWRHRIELPILQQADPYKEVDFTSEQSAVMEFPDVSSWRDERLLRVVKSCTRIRIPYRVEQVDHGGESILPSPSGYLHPARPDGLGSKYPIASASVHPVR
jgi:hypothetical protein